VNITVVGTGYVGLVAGAGFAETGNVVIGADIDNRKIDLLKQNVLPIYEPGLEVLVERNQAAGRLTFTTDVGGAIAAADVVIIAVGTPPDEDGSADLRYVLEVADRIGECMERETVVVTKSTVPVGTSSRVRERVGRRARHPFHVVSNPEFLKEGAAVDDFMKPDRVVLGTDSEFATQLMTELYGPFVRTGNPVVVMDLASAELTKYAANAMLATRVSFMNEIARLCELVGADVDLVRKGIGTDDRIGPAFLFPGPGYGGSCFPKDVSALARSARQEGITLRILEAVEAVNAEQKRRMFVKLSAALDGGVTGKRIAVWGLAFKPNTDDMREAPALTLIDELLVAGATVVAHDPVALDEARRRYSNRPELGSTFLLAPDAYAALEQADALALVTDWNEYRHPDFERIRSLLRQPVIVDGRNLFPIPRMTELGFRYEGIGRPPVGQ
jgi:UDPglucose 6-dehydrogenase